jgi:hypothetical protein
MKKKLWIAIAAICFTCLGGVLKNFLQKEDYACVPITFGMAKWPFVTVKIYGNSYPLELDLGSQSFLKLDSNITSFIKKRDYGLTAYLDLKGNYYQSSRYLLDEIHIGKISFNEVLTDEQNNSFFLNSSFNGKTSTDRPLGAIGRLLLRRINLFLDFPHSQLILTNSAKRLKKAGYSIEGMTRVPFHVSRVGLVLLIETDLGEKKFSLDTGSTYTLLRSSLMKDQNLTEKEEGLPAFTSSRFQMGGKDFGCRDLYRFDFADEFTEIDGVLGMDFMRNHQLYIDYPNRIIYIGDAIP